MRAAGRNLGFLQQIRLGTFVLPAGGGSVEFIFNGMPEQAPGGGYYDVKDIILRFPTGAIQFNCGGGQIVTARSLYSCFKWTFVMGANTPQARMGGPTSPEKIFSNAPGGMVADFLAMHSRARLVDVDGAGIWKREIAPTAAVKSGVLMAPSNEFDYSGFAGFHGPYGAGTAFGVGNQVDLYIPLGRRANDWFAEDDDDTGIPSNHLSGKALGANGVEMEPARLQLDLNTTTEGGNAITWGSAQVIEVWATILVRRPGRGGFPTLPCFRWAAPPGNSTDVVFSPGYHFWSGFGAQDTTGRGNVDANLNILTQTFATFSVRQGNNVGDYKSATEYLKTLSALIAESAPGRRQYGFSASDNPIQPTALAVLRERMGIFPVGTPLPILLGMGSDALNDLVVSYTAPTPTVPYQLQCSYPLYTAEAMNLAARASGINNAICVDAVDSQIPEGGLSALIPKAIRAAA